MTEPAKPLTPDEKLWAFRKATNSMEGAPARWTERVSRGLNDEQLAEAIRYELGEVGGYWGESVNIEYEGSGMKIWTSHGVPHRHTAAPLCAGPATLRLAREIYGIRDPDEKQMGLF